MLFLLLASAFASINVNRAEPHPFAPYGQNDDVPNHVHPVHVTHHHTHHVHKIPIRHHHVKHIPVHHYHVQQVAVPQPVVINHTHSVYSHDHIDDERFLYDDQALYDRNDVSGFNNRIIDSGRYADRYFDNQRYDDNSGRMTPPDYTFFGPIAGN